MSDRIGAAMDRAFEAGGVFVVPNRAVWLVAGDIIYKRTDPETTASYEAWLGSLSVERAQEAAILAADWYGTMDELIAAVEAL